MIIMSIMVKMNAWGSPNLQYLDMGVVGHKGLGLGREKGPEKQMISKKQGGDKAEGASSDVIVYKVDIPANRWVYREGCPTFLTRDPISRYWAYGALWARVFNDDVLKRKCPPTPT